MARGNPLALTELAAAPTAGPSRTERRTELPLTARLERAFTSRYAELPEPVRTLLLVAAAGDTNDLRELVSAAELLAPGVAGDPDVWAAAVEADLVTVWEQRVEFRHPLVRSAIYQSATSAQRVAVHTALAAILQDYPDRRVWHRAAATLGPGRGDRRRDRGGRRPRRGARRSAVALEALERSALLTPDLGAAPTGSCARRSWHWSSATRRPPRASGSTPEAEALGPRSRGRLRLLTETLAPAPSSAAGVAAKARELIGVADQMSAQGDADLALRFAHLAALQTWVTDVGQDCGAPSWRPPSGSRPRRPTRCCCPSTA